jgi:hypothetical protein
MWVEMGQYLGTSGRAVQIVSGAWVGIGNTQVHPALSEDQRSPDVDADEACCEL